MQATKHRSRILATALAAAALAGPLAARADWTYQQVTDALHAVMESDRTVYTRLIVNRLQNEEKVIKASEHWKDEKALVLPAQMFRYGSEMVAEKDPGFTYALISTWPVNKQNGAKTPVEKDGLAAIVANPAKAYYKEETLAGKKYFTAVYPDKAVAKACIACHNDHKDSPKRDFKMGDVMGGVVIRLPMKEAAMRGALIPLLVLAAGPAAAQKFPVFDVPELQRGREVWMGTCIACHGNPDSDAPQMLDKAAWKPRLAKGTPALYRSALGGFKGESEMPPRGGNPSLNDDDVKRAVDYMTHVARP